MTKRKIVPNTKLLLMTLIVIASSITQAFMAFSATPAYATEPAPVAWQPSDLTSISVGGSRTCAIAQNEIYCTIAKHTNGWYGYLSKWSRGAIPTNATISKVVAGGVIDAECALADGKVYCWGNNLYGQLGNPSIGVGNGKFTLAPIAIDDSGVLAGKTVTDLAMYDNLVCVVASGKPYCWGQDEFGAGLFGDGTMTKDIHASPVAIDTTGVLNGKIVSKIALNNDHVCVLADGQPYCWGKNDKGQLGNATKIDSSLPVAVDTSGVLNGKSATSLSLAQDVSCVLVGGSAYCWGNNNAGSFASSSAPANAPQVTPVEAMNVGLLEGKHIDALAADSYSSCALSSGHLYCTGSNGRGGLGNNSTVSSTSPVEVVKTGLLANDTFTGISSESGWSHYCATTSSNYVACWGYNNQYFVNPANTNPTNGDNLSGYTLVPTPLSSLYVGPLTISPVSMDLNADPVDVTITTAEADRGIAKVTFGGVEMPIVEQTDLNHVKVRVTKPVGITTDTAVDVAVTSSMGLVSTKENGFTYGYSPEAPMINDVSFTTASGRRVLQVSGQNLVGKLKANEYADALYRSLVSLNGVALPFCAGNDLLGATAATYIGYGYSPSLISDNPPCYLLTENAGTTVSIGLTQALIWLPDGFDESATGTVGVNHSNIYHFNIHDNTVTTSAGIGDKTLSGNDITLPKRPTFSGTAEPNSAVRVEVHSDPIICETTADADGNWACTLPSSVQPGIHTVKITVTHPDSTVEVLGPYTVTVSSSTLSNTDVLAPHTGYGYAENLETIHKRAITELLIGLGMASVIIAAAILWQPRRRITHVR